MEQEKIRESRADAVIAGWLSERDEDQLIHKNRIYLEASKSPGNQAREVKEISEKLNRLERNFLWEKDYKREVKQADTAAQGIFQLDQIYHRIHKQIASLSQTRKQEKKEIMGQIVFLYNHSTAAIATRQRLEKELKARAARMEALASKRASLVQEKQALKLQGEEVQNRHWLRMRQLESISQRRF